MYVKLSRTKRQQFSSVAQSCPTPCDPMNRSTPDLTVHHQLQEFTQSHVHRAGGPSSHLILCRPLLLLPPIPPKRQHLTAIMIYGLGWQNQKELLLLLVFSYCCKL